MSRTVLLSVSNCLDCPKHFKFRDPGSDDSFDALDESVVCTAVEGKRKYVVACERWNLRKHCEVPDWCPLPMVGKKVK